MAEALLDDDEIRQILKVNEYQGIVYFNKEAFERTLWRLMAVAVIDLTADPAMPAGDVPDAIVETFETIQALYEAEMRSAYQLEKLKAALAVLS